jgi:hypothetical protein
MIFPINFSIPKEKLCNAYSEKKKLVSDLIPGKPNTYIYNNEEDYYNEYKQSYFAVTTKKAGWDCMRHYEILANGCIPNFIDIEKSPINTMTLLPKDLLLEANKLYNKFKDTTLTEELINEYNLLRDKLFDHTKAHLTTEKMAGYILQKAGVENVAKVLYLSGTTGPDYLRCVTLHGFKTVFGTRCHDYPKVPHIYKSASIDYKKLYGKGITYTNLLEPSLHDDGLDLTIVEDIKNKYYDIIIYGSYHRGMPYYDLISKTYKPNEVILLCGEDLHQCNYNQYVNKGHFVFVREL